MGDSLIRLEDVHITLDGAAGAVKILKGISLDVPRGSAVAVLGPSGSGKSTLLAAVGGLEGVTSGKLTVADSDLTRLDEDGLALFRRHHVAIVFQSFHLLPTMTALENVAAPLELAGKPDPFTRAARELKAVGLEARTGHYPSQLSGGEQQRVALARALAADPALILADEPTGNLDGETGEMITELLFAAQRDRGTTLLLVTHDEVLAARCDRIVRIRDGLIADDTLTRQTAA
ncbi:MAG: ATP-binding cassette domain-containing protein [Minwuia sp.]|nr:ATP-binding cassette domain-containing protein [Minwuia sp.]